MAASISTDSLRTRRNYLDWMRGLAVLVMMEAHVVDSWTRAADKQSWPYAWSMILGGFGAPLFLFLAGVSVSLSAGARLRRTGHAGLASKAVMFRGLQVFGLAFLFRIQAWILSLSPAWKLLKVDILNIMGPSIVAAAALWGAARTVRWRYAAFAGATLAVTFLTPLARTTSVLNAVPDPLEAYLRPSGGYTSFCFFPWSGFLFAGALIGLTLDGTTTRQSEVRLNSWLPVAGVTLALGAYAASYLPSLYWRSEFWGSSPSFFLLRTGLLIAAIGLSFWWDTRLEPNRASPLKVLGRNSLFIYWIHVEMVYGVISNPLHAQLSLTAAWAWLGAFSIFMLACAIAKERVVELWKARASSLWRKPAEASLRNPI